MTENLGEVRDLAITNPWADSLERSLARRGRQSPLRSLLRERGGTDLAGAEPWLDSLSRSRARRAAAARNADVLVGRRKASLAALLAVGAPTGAALAGGAASAAPALASMQGHMLKRGTRGGGVARLQRALGIAPDGIFGPQTARAVKGFQRAHGLTVDGIAGSATWGALGGAGARTAASSSRSASAAVARLGGAALRRLQRGIGVAADGIWGPQTARAVRAFQAAHGLAVDGIPGPLTFAALGAGSARTSRVGLSAGGGGGVRRLQSLLGVTADGVFGPQTKAAVVSFQRGHGLVADGIVGPATWSGLGAGSGPLLRMRGRPSAGTATSSSPGVVARVIAAGDAIATRPYVYGGGHGSFVSAGYDCSGSVSYALHGGGLIAAPEDSSQLESYGAPGPGRYITIYANAGHTWMTVDGRRFDTSAMSQTGGSRWGGGARSGAGYVVRHPVGY